MGINIEGIQGGGSTPPHPLLDGTQNNDTLAAAPTRGTVIVGNSTPLWAKLLPGVAGTYMRFNGTDTVFSSIQAADHAHALLDALVNNDTVASGPVRGGVIVANSTSAWAQLARGSAGQYLRSNGTDLLYSALLAGDISGVLAPVQGGTGTSTAFTAGSIVFAGASGTYMQDNGNLFWDETNKRLGIGTASPIRALEVVALTGTDPLRIHTSGASRTGFLVDSTAGQQALLDFLDGGVEKFQFGKNKDNSFFIYDNANAGYPFGIYPTAKVIALDAYNLPYNVGIGTASPGAQLNVTSALEIFQTAALIAGSVGSLICPYDTATGETDAKGGNLNGAIVVNNADGKIYVRTGGVWKGVAVAGYSIPKDELRCPACREPMTVGQFVAGYRDKDYPDGDGHWLACHLKCALEKEKEQMGAAEEQKQSRSGLG